VLIVTHLIIRKLDIGQFGQIVLAEHRIIHQDQVRATGIYDEKTKTHLERCTSSVRFSIDLPCQSTRNQDGGCLRSISNAADTPYFQRNRIACRMLSPRNKPASETNGDDHTLPNPAL
jgi:hypothetical protein